MGPSHVGIPFALDDPILPGTRRMGERRSGGGRFPSVMRGVGRPNVRYDCLIFPGGPETATRPSRFEIQTMLKCRTTTLLNPMMSLDGPVCQ